MSPRLEGKETNQQLAGRKFVRVGDEIAIQDPSQDTHMEICWEYFPNQPEFGVKPIVDDKGEIEDTGGKLHFAGRQTGTVIVRREGEESRAKTIDVAKKILGNERVID